MQDYKQNSASSFAARVKIQLKQGLQNNAVDCQIKIHYIDLMITHEV